MSEKIYQKALNEINLLSGVKKVTIIKDIQEIKGPAKNSYDKQEKYINRSTSSIKTTTIFIVNADNIFKIDLSRSVYSDRFNKIKESSERIIKQHFNEYNASHDKLTEIYNRHGLEECLSDENLKDKILTYCTIDIDNFKQINDSHSHDTGDKVIKHLAQKLKESCLQLVTECHSIFFARYGGEEFTIIIIDDKENVGLAEKIRHSACGEVENIKYTVSLGLSAQLITSKTAPASIKKLYQEADLALYKAKKEGKNRSVNFLKIREQSGTILEVDKKFGIIAIDLGSKVEAKKGDHYQVFPEKYSGFNKFILSDGRTQKAIGTYPKVKFCEIELFDVQEEISFAKLKDGDFELLEVGARLELVGHTPRPLGRKLNLEK